MEVGVMEDPKIDLSKVAQGGDKEDANLKGDEETSHQAARGEDTDIVSFNSSAQVVIQNPDLAWIEATQGLQRNLIRSLQDYKASRTDRKALAIQRERMITEVTEQYVNYLREEAKLASKIALEARDSILRQELIKLKAKLGTEIAEVTGVAVTEIERIGANYTAKINSPTIQRAYAQFVMGRIFDLLEQSPS
jgi:uncharacterized membrane-anchored protein YjiN (DUF445 family)